MPCSLISFLEKRDGFIFFQGCLKFFPSPPILVHKIKCNVIIFYHGYKVIVSKSFDVVETVFRLKSPLHTGGTKNFSLIKQSINMQFLKISFWQGFTSVQKGKCSAR